MNCSDLERERDQLIGWWNSIIHDNLHGSIEKISRVRRGRVRQNPRMLIRRLHDRLGFRAGGNVLCAGSIFRTGRFIETKNRIGNRKGQTVHIEHTVPICVLDTQFQLTQTNDRQCILEWFLKHSVVTAFHVAQREYLCGVHRTSDVFDVQTVGHQKPFMRYRRLFDSGETVWNVFSGTQICPEKFTFEEHYSIIQELKSVTRRPD